MSITPEVISIYIFSILLLHGVKFSLQSLSTSKIHFLLLLLNLPNGIDNLILCPQVPFSHTYLLTCNERCVPSHFAGMEVKEIEDNGDEATTLLEKAQTSKCNVHAHTSTHIHDHTHQAYIPGRDLRLSSLHRLSANDFYVA